MSRPSVGLATRTAGRLSSAVLIDEADKALYAAKAAGRDRVVAAARTDLEVLTG